MSSPVGMPDVYAGEVPVLFVVPSPGETIDADRLRVHVDEKMNEPPAKPKQIVVLDSLPVTAVGKIFKPALRDLAIRERVRLKVSARFGEKTRHSVEVDKDVKLNTIFRVPIDSTDNSLLQKPADNLSALPQGYVVRQIDR